MCQVFKSAKLKEIDSELVTKHADAEVIESRYHRCMGALAIKVITKVPPMTDRTLYKVNELTICNLGRNKATFVEVPKHFTKMSKATGTQIIQNFYVPATCLGGTMELFADVRRRVNRNGMAAYVINYYEVPADMKRGKPIKLKIGTPKRYPKEVKRIPLSNGTAITFVDL